MANEKRLIDANELSERIKSYAGMFTDELGFVVSLEAVTRGIDFSKTVDAVEVVHAHWEDGCAMHNGKEVYKSIDCSHCNEIFKTEDREYWKKRFRNLLLFP